jgi:hypothetical protein
MGGAVDICFLRFVGDELLWEAGSGGSMRQWTELMLSDADPLPEGSAGVSVTAARERERRSSGSPEDAVTWP